MNELTYCDCKVGKCEGKEHSRCAFIHAKTKGQSLPIDNLNNCLKCNPMEYYVENIRHFKCKHCGKEMK